MASLISDIRAATPKRVGFVLLSRKAECASFIVPFR
jgi:hypothetical protein